MKSLEDLIKFSRRLREKSGGELRHQIYLEYAGKKFRIQPYDCSSYDNITKAAYNILRVISPEELLIIVETSLVVIEKDDTFEAFRKRHNIKGRLQQSNQALKDLNLIRDATSTIQISGRKITNYILDVFSIEKNRVIWTESIDEVAQTAKEATETLSGRMVDPLKKVLSELCFLELPKTIELHKKLTKEQADEIVLRAIMTNLAEDYRIDTIS